MPVINFNEVFRRINQYIIPELNIRFINRKFELRKLIDWIWKIDIPWNFIIYGPWGCGKSEFFKALTYAFSEIEDVVIFYFDLVRERLDFILTSLTRLKHTVLDLVKNLHTLTHIAITLYELIKDIHKRFSLKGRRVIVILDEVKKVKTLLNIESEHFITYLEKCVRELKNDLRLENIHVIVLTSELTMLKEFKKFEGKFNTILQFWHIPEDEAIKLIDQLGIKQELLPELNYYVNGCPRRIIEFCKIYQQDLQLWKLSLIEHVYSTIIEFCRKFQVLPIEIFEKLKDMLNSGIDLIETTPYFDILLENNIMTFLEMGYKRLSRIPENKPWIGNRIAFQLPIYYEVLLNFREYFKFLVN